MEDRIRDLCKRAIQATNEQDALQVLKELRGALDKHVEGARDKVIATSSFSDGRSHGRAKKAA